MHRSWQLPLAPVVTLLLCAPALASEVHAPEGASDESVPTLRPYQIHLVRQWFKQVGERRTDETFGDLVARVGEWQVGKPYGGVFKSREGVEQLRVSLSRFECVSFVETTLAVARCVWRGEADETCFAREVLAFRYRDGELVDYASRLHYFTDWIENNALREHVINVTAALGGSELHQQFNYMSENLDQFDGLEDPDQLEQILVVESRLSTRTHVVLASADVSAAQSSLQNGDLIAVVSNKLPGLMIGHVGFVDRWMGGKPRFLHASSYHEKVVLTTTSVTHYATRQAHRQGIIVIRPLPPGEQGGQLAQLVR